jgi:protoporphyrinogen oxidase
VELLRKSPRHEFCFQEEPRSIRRNAKGFHVEFTHGRAAGNFSHVIWTGHLDRILEIVEGIDGIDLAPCRAAAAKLKYRHLVLLNYVFRQEDVRTFKEHWIDVHDPDIRALRVTNFSNYNTDQNVEMCGVGMEYNCWPTDDVWKCDDDTLQELGLHELRAMSLASVSAKPRAFSAVRLERAYPVYFKGYREELMHVLDATQRIPGLVVTGRNGLYKWNNMHHSVKTGILAARNVLGESYDLLSVKGMVSIGKDSD